MYRNASKTQEPQKIKDLHSSVLDFYCSRCCKRLLFPDKPVSSVVMWESQGRFFICKVLFYCIVKTNRLSLSLSTMCHQKKCKNQMVIGYVASAPRKGHGGCLSCSYKSHIHPCFACRHVKKKKEKKGLLLILRLLKSQIQLTFTENQSFGTNKVPYKRKQGLVKQSYLCLNPPPRR